MLNNVKNNYVPHPFSVQIVNTLRYSSELEQFFLRFPGQYALQDVTNHRWLLFPIVSFLSTTYDVFLPLLLCDYDETTLRTDVFQSQQS